MRHTSTLIALILLGNIFLIIAGWNTPAESNIAAYMLWFIISSTYIFSSWKLKLPMSLGLAFLSGNTLLILFSLVRGGYTFNLGAGEYTSLFTMVIGITCWSTYGAITKKWDARWLLVATIAADVLSFYPHNKQYFGPNEVPSYFLFLGAGTWSLSMLYNLVFIDKFFKKLADKKEKLGTTILNSAISIENFFLLLMTMFVMSG